MKNYINIALLTLLIILSTVYFINCRKMIMMKANETLDLYNSINHSLDELYALNKATPGDSNINKQGNGNNIYGDNSFNGNDNSNINDNPYHGGNAGTGNAVEAANPNTEVLDGYFVTIIDNKIVVTLGDKETILEHTNIPTDQLDSSEILKLQNGIYVDDIMNVFGILESLSS